MTASPEANWYAFTFRGTSSSNPDIKRIISKGHVYATSLKEAVDKAYEVVKHDLPTFQPLKSTSELVEVTEGLTLRRLKTIPKWLRHQRGIRGY